MRDILSFSTFDNVETGNPVRWLTSDNVQPLASRRLFRTDPGFALVFTRAQLHIRFSHPTTRSGAGSNRPARDPGSSRRRMAQVSQRAAIYLNRKQLAKRE